MNYYENFVSIHNITNSTDLRDFIFLVPVLGLLMPHGVGFWGLFLTSLLRREVTVYLLDCLWHLVSPWANALASVVEQDWWVVFAFHHICLCKSSHLCIKLLPSSMPCLGNMQLTLQPVMPWLRCSHYSLDQDRPGAGVFAYLVELDF